MTDDEIDQVLQALLSGIECELVGWLDCLTGPHGDGVMDAVHLEMADWHRWALCTFLSLN